eukprot:CAMPEP_0184856508 /NCGR_PEP_ID=MMETSP0580-20130426/1697_1 /TAXON_ID=1118495 /ORGANISM="Dactyliosolen fragilissimus" /LENGTH=164 /DNA_ID=CAMNT_0027351585 /DNA_START=12 /DNA_END=506 /DNA_ORIENTATION=+
MNTYKNLAAIISSLWFLDARVIAFAPVTFLTKHRAAFLDGNYALKSMHTIADGVEFDIITREWRCKWSTNGDMVSLVQAQIALESVLEELKLVDGIRDVERIVCGSCQDFKIVTSVNAEKFGAWEKNKFYPEEDLLEMLKHIDDISDIETQTYTKTSMINIQIE